MTLSNKLSLLGKKLDRSFAIIFLSNSNFWKNLFNLL